MGRAHGDSRVGFGGTNPEMSRGERIAVDLNQSAIWGTTINGEGFLPSI